MARLQELINQLELEKLDNLLFRGESENVGTGRVFGGQVLGQAISAAQATVADRQIHSAHCYFLRPGDHDLPIIYHVDATRDGGSYSSRTVTASQKGNTIFTMMCSFQVQENSELEFVERIEGLNLKNPHFHEIDLEHEPDASRRSNSVLLNQQPFKIRFPEESPEHPETVENFWLRTNEALPDNPALHRSLLAYASDFRLLASTLRTVGYRFRLEEVMMATICHGIWFHREFRMDEWLYITCESLAVGNGRGIARGGIYNQKGERVASTIQEGVVRKRH